jgi:type II secretory ATPase GspE/PulE/Tfp pilus assembly ATPase PilB-like protein
LSFAFASAITTTLRRLSYNFSPHHFLSLYQILGYSVLCTELLEWVQQRFPKSAKRVGLQVKIHKSKDEARTAATDKTVSAIIERALARGATDIHIEPRARNIVVRFRIDGWLQEVTKLPSPALEDIVHVLKTKGGLDTSLLKAPQNGSYTFESEQIQTVVHVATMPTVNGEKIVLQLSRQLSEPATLEALGYWGDSLDRLERAIAQPHGLVVAASLHQAGATMSLLGVVHLLNNPALNIATLEDPIEHQIAGVNQTQIDVSAGVTFTSGLLALLHQDPNVVMISDLHDAEAVYTAVQAALSGRLLMGGMHANDASHAIVQLLNMHVEPFLIATALKLSIGQRYVRRLCTSCAKTYEPDEATRKELRTILKSCGVTSMRTLHDLERSAMKHNLGTETGTQHPHTTEKTITKLYRANPEGCPHCAFSGYSGRVGICEVLTASDPMKKLIASNPTTAEIRALAIKEGMIPLALDGLLKALRGITTIEEIVPLALIA